MKKFVLISVFLFSRIMVAEVYDPQPMWLVEMNQSVITASDHLTVASKGTSIIPFVEYEKYQNYWKDLQHENEQIRLNQSMIPLSNLNDAEFGRAITSVAAIVAIATSVFYRKATFNWKNISIGALSTVCLASQVPILMSLGVMMAVANSVDVGRNTVNVVKENIK